MHSLPFARMYTLSGGERVRRCYLHVVDDGLEQSAQRSALLLHRLHGVRAHANERGGGAARGRQGRKDPGAGRRRRRRLGISGGIRSTAPSWTSDGGEKSRSSGPPFFCCHRAGPAGQRRRWRCSARGCTGFARAQTNKKIK